VAQFSSGTGHFTQVVWKSTTTFGVGVALSDDGRTDYVVAQYSPPGKYKDGSKENVFSQQQCYNTEVTARTFFIDRLSVLTK
jgi:hypothetical protein